MLIEIIKNNIGFEKIKIEWEELEKNENISFFQTFNFNFTWWNIVKKNEKNGLYIIVLREESGKILLIAPFVIEKIKKCLFEYKVLKFMGYGDYRGVLICSKNINRGKILTKLFESIKVSGADKIILDNIDIESELGIFLKKDQNLNKYFLFQEECPRIKIKDYLDYDDYKKKYNSKNINNLKNKLSKELKYKVNVRKITQDIHMNISNIHIDLQKRLNENSKNKNRRSIFLKDEYDLLLKKLIDNSDKLEIFSLEINEKIVSYIYVLKHNSKSIIWNIGHDYNYHKYALGRILNSHMIEECFQSKEKIIDFGCGGYSWKYQLTDDFTLVYKLEFDINEKKLKRYNKLRMIKKGLRCLIGG